MKSLFKLFAIILFANSLFAGDIVNIDVPVKGTVDIDLNKSIRKILIADREVAGVVKRSAKKATIIGHGIGATDIRFIDSRGRIITQVNAKVTQNIAEISSAIAKFLPNEMVEVGIIGDSISLSGIVSNAENASNAVKIAKEISSSHSETKILNFMQVRTAQQVMLRVRVGEIKREALTRFGLGAHGLISADIEAIGALEKNGLFKILAEPNLVAISGQKANFLAGGEFPIPVAQGDNKISVDYKKFGVGVSFTPYVLTDKRIRLSVESEVSDINNINKVKFSSIKLPMISTRRANTTIELAPGESFMIAGLIKDNTRQNLSQIPGISSIPILSSLFRSTEFKKNETELVIAVTPYLVDPLKNDDVKLPTDNFIEPSEADRIFFGRLTGKELKEKPSFPFGFMFN